MKRRFRDMDDTSKAIVRAGRRTVMWWWFWHMTVFPPFVILLPAAIMAVISTWSIVLWLAVFAALFMAVTFRDSERPRWPTLNGYYGALE